MRLPLHSLLLLAALSSAACNRSADRADAHANDAATLPDESAAVPAATGAAGFANALAASDRFELESSRLAASVGSSAAVKSFADHMIKDHSASSAKLKAALAEGSEAITPDDTLNAEQQAALDGLRGKTGAQFDAAYAAAQQTAHQKALDTLKSYAASGDNPKLKALASELVPIVTAHLNLANGLK